MKERIEKLKPKTFCEIGSGNGYISNLLLGKGMKGKGYDLNESACKNNLELNKKYVLKQDYQIINDNFLIQNNNEKYDYIISCMVIEHLDAFTVNKYFEVCKSALNHNGSIAVFVPSNMKYWGIEDEIAGHFKRYTFNDFKILAKNFDLKISDIAGLNYPISNLLLSLSNRIVKNNEGYKQNLSKQEQTVLSGNRNIKFKTTFPWYFKFFLNNFTMFPFHIIQKINKKNNNSMVIYCELKK
ncbi:MAG: methyltransferase domain-containing protein [Taibaiella sp.]|nr:methyltransferase domain-containing protein [Taibaiella sp.]